MSGTAALAILFAADLLGFFCVSYVSWKANHLGHLIAVGEVNGKPIPNTYRQIMIYQHWLSWLLMAVGCAALIAIANLKVAQLEPSVKPVAYFTVFGCGVSAFSWLAHGTREFVYFRLVLRDAAKAPRP